MRSKTFKADSLLLLTSAIWGFAFVAQRTGMKFVGPFAFNGVRFALGSLSLLPLIVFLDRKKAGGSPQAISAASGALASAEAAGARRKRLVVGSTLMGTVLFVAASLQQIGMQFTGAGKAGFITGLYVVLVPIFGIALRQKTGKATWVGAAVAVAGLYFLSASGGFEAINVGDVLVAVGAVFWAIHVLLVDYFSKRSEPLKLAVGQFALCALASLAASAIARENLSFGGLFDAALPIAYGGFFSVGIAYTLQIVAQKDAPPAHSAILLSLESVFAAIGGILVLSEKLSAADAIGCALMFLGMLSTQWELFFAKRRRPG